MIYLISDTHFYHDNIIEYCNRPFDSIDDMNKTIIDNWNKKVKQDDVVYHLGDFILNNNKIDEIIKELNGKIFLICGNHDQKSISFYNSKGINILPSKTIIDNHKIILSHKPLPDNQIPEGYINVHGHIHEKELDEKTFNRNIHVNVSVDVINYSPISIDKIKI